MATWKLLNQIYAFEDALVSAINAVNECVVNVGGGNGGGNGGGGTPSPTPSPNPYESPCPYRLDMSQMVNDYDAKAQQARNLPDGRLGNGKTIALSDVETSNQTQTFVAHSGEVSRPSTIRTPEEDGRNRYFTKPPLNKKGDPYSFYDAERKLMEYIADINQNAVSSSNIILYADRATCQHCQPIAGEFRKMFREKFPTMNLLWFDKTGKCY